MHTGVFRLGLVAVLAGAVGLMAAPTAAAPQAVACGKGVTIRYDAAAWQPVADPGPADGPCELALNSTPTAGTTLRFVTLKATAKELPKLKKMKGEERIALLANQVAGGAASPPQDLEVAGPYSVGFAMARGPGGATSYLQIASTLYDKAMLYVVLEQQLPQVDPAPRYDKDAARRTLLGFLAGVQLAAPTKK